jgi:hypothetical protein
MMGVLMLFVVSVPLNVIGPEDTTVEGGSVEAEVDLSVALVRQSDDELDR